MDTQVLFEADKDGYYNCRIPGIVVTASGVILAYCESRQGNGGDWDPIDIRLRRSLDGGETWEPACIIVDHLQYSQTVNNVVMIADQQSGRVVVLFCVEYARAYRMYSDDDGATFSEPEEITHAFDRIRDTYPFDVLAIGPGHGIQLRSGRMVAPIWVSPSHSHRPNRCGTIFSDDEGKTWQAGELLPETFPNCNESTVVEMADGRVMINCRNQDIANVVPDPNDLYRVTSISRDGARDWSEPKRDRNLPDAICFGSLCRYDDNTILFSNATNQHCTGMWHPDRTHLTVRVSQNDGKTWIASRLIGDEKTIMGYSDLAVREGSILLLHELAEDSSKPWQDSLYLTRFSLDWLLNA